MWHGQFHTANGLKAMFANVANFLLKNTEPTHREEAKLVIYMASPLQCKLAQIQGD